MLSGKLSLLANMAGAAAGEGEGEERGCDFMKNTLHERLEEIIELFKQHEIVKFIIPGLGETKFKTAEFKQVIETLEKLMKCPCERFWSASMKTSCFDLCDRRPKPEEYEEEPKPRNCPRCGQGMFSSETKRN